jgi:hypothetical protein
MTELAQPEQTWQAVPPRIVTRLAGMPGWAICHDNPDAVLVAVRQFADGALAQLETCVNLDADLTASSRIFELDWERE